MPAEWQGQSTGGGGAGSVGGIEATVSLDTSQLGPGIEGLKAKLAELGGRLEALGPQSATSTRAIAANMDRVGQMTNAAGYKLQVFAQGLDDLQYVGEQGLRPILNNLVQISPALGVAALAVDQLVKSMGGWKEVLSDLGVISPIETAAQEMKRLGDLTERTANEQDRLNRLRRGEAAVEAARASETPEQKATAAAVQGAVAGAGFGKVRDMVMAAQEKPKLTQEDAAAIRREEAFRANPFARIPGGLFGYGLSEQAGMAQNLAGGYGTDARKAIADRQAREGNANAERLIGEASLPGAAGLAARQQLEKFAREAGDVDLAAKVQAAGPGAMQGRAIDEETDRRLKVQRAAEMDDLEAESRHNAGLYDARQKAIRTKIDRGQALTEDELSGMSPENRERRRDREVRVGEQRERLTERGGDLNWRLRQLMNPERQGQTLGGEAYAASFQAITGDSPEVKRLHAIEEVLKDIRENNRQIKLIGRKARGGGGN